MILENIGGNTVKVKYRSLLFAPKIYTTDVGSDTFMRRWCCGNNSHLRLGRGAVNTHTAQLKLFEDSDGPNKV